jgi:pyridoxal/pyridoxine/pyridoxamine kinase
MSGRGIKFYARRPTLEQQLTDNLKEIEENPNAEMLPITEGYLAFQKGGEALEEFLKQQKAKHKAEQD